MPRAHRFTFFISQRDASRDVLPFQQRDVAAQLEIIAALHAQGYAYGDALLNTPPAASAPGADELAPVDVSLVAAGDLIVTATRPPLSDEDHLDRKRVRRGRTTLEPLLFAAWARYLDVISRSHVRLTPRARAALRPGFESRRDMTFREEKGAWYYRLGGKPVPREPRTAAFLLRVETLWPGGPGLLGVFGMDGISTLVWAYLLRHELPSLLREPGFVIAELHGGPVPKRPTDLRWALDWKPEIVLHQRP